MNISLVAADAATSANDVDAAKDATTFSIPTVYATIKTMVRFSIDLWSRHT